MSEPIYLKPIDWHIKPVFNLSVTTDIKLFSSSMRIYRCGVGAKTINEAYRKLRELYELSLWVAEHSVVSQFELS